MHRTSGEQPAPTPTEPILSIINFILHNRPLEIDDNYFIEVASNDESCNIAKSQIKHAIRLAGTHQCAALILFDLLRALASHKHQLPRAHADIITAMNHDDLTLHFMGKIFSYLITRNELVTNNADAQTASVEKSAVVSLTSGIAGGLWHYAATTVQQVACKSFYSTEWQHTMSCIRDIALCKLRTEVTALDSLHDQQKFLNAAKTMLIFNEHQSNSALTGAFGDTNAIKEINNLLNTVNSRLQSMRHC